MTTSTTITFEHVMEAASKVDMFNEKLEICFVVPCNHGLKFRIKLKGGNEYSGNLWETKSNKMRNGEKLEIPHNQWVALIYGLLDGLAYKG